jgi:hypothetical protein
MSLLKVLYVVTEDLIFGHQIVSDLDPAVKGVVEGLGRCKEDLIMSQNSPVLLICPISILVQH